MKLRDSEHIPCTSTPEYQPADEIWSS